MVKPQVPSSRVCRPWCTSSLPLRSSRRNQSLWSWLDLASPITRCQTAIKTNIWKGDKRFINFEIVQYWKSGRILVEEEKNLYGNWTFKSLWTRCFEWRWQIPSIICLHMVAMTGSGMTTWLLIIKSKRSSYWELLISFQEFCLSLFDSENKRNGYPPIYWKKIKHSKYNWCKQILIDENDILLMLPLRPHQLSLRPPCTPLQWKAHPRP